MRVRARIHVREAGVQLQRPLEEPQGRLVLLLQTEAVAEDAPGLGGHAVDGHQLVGQVPAGGRAKKECKKNVRGM